jgi:outer membrane protein TolC
MEREFNKPPLEAEDKIKGLTEAIKATERRIEAYKVDGSDISELKTHLESLKNQLYRAENELENKFEKAA